MKGELVLVNELESFENEFEVTVSRYPFGLLMYVDDIKTLELQLSRKDDIREGIDDYISYLKCYSDRVLDIEELKKYENLKGNVDNLWDNIEYVKLNFNEDVNILEFIENNPMLLNKRIVISECLDIKDYDKINELLLKYNKYKDNIFVSLDNNMEYVSLVDCLNTISKIKKQADRILSLNLSVMETIMYTYDLVRNRVYKSEGKDDSVFESRDLSAVLSGDKIVCVGYANIFQALLYYMNINCFNVGMSSKVNGNAGHERNIIYVKDLKYGIDGVYYFDVTWDSKKELEINEFLNRYFYFARTRKQMIEIESDRYIYDECPYYSLNMVDEISAVMEMGDLSKLDREYAKSLNYMGYLVDGKRLIDRMCLLSFAPNYNKFDRKKLLSRLKNIEDKFNKPISAEVFLKLFNNVRKIEYYENSEFYPYNVNNIYETYIRSGWDFSRHYYSNEERLLMSIFCDDGEKISGSRDNRKEDFINFMCDVDLNRNIKEVQLTKVLQKIRDKNR